MIRSGFGCADGVTTVGLVFLWRATPSTPPVSAALVELVCCDEPSPSRLESEVEGGDGSCHLLITDMAVGDEAYYVVGEARGEYATFC